MLVMKRIACAIGLGVAAVSFASVTPAMADYTVIRFADGYCQIWSDSTATPWGTGWTKIAITPDWWSARAALDTAIADRSCR